MGRIKEWLEKYKGKREERRQQQLQNYQQKLKELKKERERLEIIDRYHREQERIRRLKRMQRERKLAPLRRMSGSLTRSAESSIFFGEPTRRKKKSTSIFEW